METLILYCHPYEGSYNHAILEAVRKGIERRRASFDVIDLVGEGFNPVMSSQDLAGYSKGVWADPKVGEYQNRIAGAAYLVIIAPIWWGTIPAVLKGFFDKVFLEHWAYEITKYGMFKGKIRTIRKAVVISTMNAPKTIYNWFLGNPFKHSLIRITLKFCGIKKVKWFELYRVVTVGQKKRAKWLRDIEEYFADPDEFV